MSAQSTALWLRRYRPSPSAASRLVCFPHAGGSASFYLPWAAQLAPNVEVLAVQYPGRQDRRKEPLVASLLDMVEPIVAELAAWSDRPLAMFGHSMGAVIAFEVARHLERVGHPPLAWFFASGRGAPARSSSAGIHLLDDGRLTAMMRGIEGTDDRLLDDEELRSLVLPVIRGDFQAVESYRYRDGPGLGCPLTILTGDADPAVSVEDARAWKEHAAGECELCVFPGRHFFLLEHQAEIVRLIESRLGRAGALDRPTTVEK